VVDGGIRSVARSTFESVLADDDRAAFARLHGGRQDQRAPGKDVGMDFEADFVAADAVGLVEESAARMGRE
jgi:hypothetical protein